MATVLFADVAEFTRMSAKLGLEAIKVLMDQVFERLYEVVVRHGGVVDKYIGDCVMALFGAPIAHGDDAGRAVRAGLEMIRTCTDMRPDLAAAGLPPVEMRVGINTGPLIAGAVGAGPQRRYTVMGHTVNVAAHLQRDVNPGAVGIGEGTLARVRGLFNVAPLPGIEPPAYQVLSHRFGGLWLRPREILGAEVDMVGRGEELQQLVELARRCRQERRSTLALLVGEPGVGKTRVSAEFLAELERDSSAILIVGFADPFSAAAPFSVVADALRRKLELSSSKPAEELLRKISAMLKQLGCEPLEGDEAIFARILGIASAETTLDPATFSRRSIELLTEVVDRLASFAPVVVLIEDLQWCDASTIALAEQLLDRLRQRPLMVVGVTRPEFFREHPDALSAAERIELGPLRRDDVAEMLDRALGRTNRERLMPLVSSALGNPFHIEEVLRTLEERRVLLRSVSGWRLGAMPDDFAIPTEVEAVTQMRIDHLSSSQRRLLRDAALIGTSFWEGALNVLTRDYSPLDLSALVRRELIVREPESRFSGDPEYRFLHNAAREVAYQMIPESQRPALHLKVASWLQQKGPVNAEDLALIGMHFEAGGDNDSAANNLRQAGDVAYDAAAYAAAVSHFTHGIDLIEDHDSLFPLLARRERVFNALGRWNEQLADAERLLALANDSDQRLEALLRLGRAQLNLGRHQDARGTFDTALGLARTLETPEGCARALRWLGMYHFNRSEHREALPLFSEALRLAEDAGLDRLAAELAYELGVTIGTVGDYAQAVEVSKRALEIFRRQGNRYQEIFCLGNLGCFYVYLGAFDEAVAALQRSGDLGRQMGIPLAEASAQANLGNAYRQIGQPERAFRLEQQAKQVAARIGDLRLDADTSIYGALAALDFNDLDQAETLGAGALQLARESDMAGTEAIALMVRARVLDARGDRAAAIDSARQASLLLDGLETIEGFETEIRLTYAQLCLASEQREEAARVLTTARTDLLAKAAFIKDKTVRQQFLERVPANAAIINLFNSLS